MNRQKKKTVSLVRESTQSTTNNELARAEPVPRQRTRRMSRAEIAYELLEEAIVMLQLSPGSIVAEQELSELTGIGRTPIREAIQRLSREGLIVVLPKRGLLVTPLDLLSHIKLLEARRSFEQQACRYAAMRSTAKERQQFAAFAVSFRDCADKKEAMAFSRVDKDFNELCLSAARNPFVEGAMRLLLGLSRRFWHFYQQDVDDWYETAMLHALLAEAIADGDVAEVERRLTELLDVVEGFAKNILNFPER